MALRSIISKSNHKLRGKSHSRDVFFRAVFGENKEALLSLYNALNGTNYLDADELEIITIESAIYITRKNDVAFIISGILNLYEQQSTINGNMPVRFFIYLAQEYQKIIEKSEKSIYGRTIIPLPTPKCVILYNGSEEETDQRTMKLSDSFLLSDETPDVELTVKMININYGHNTELISKCELLDEYVRFIDILKTNISKETDNEVAINKTIIYCLKNEILEDFLRANRSEVLGMLLEEFDKKKYERSIREEEREEGRKEAKREILFALISDGTITVEKAAEISGIDIEELNQMFK